MRATSSTCTRDSRAVGAKGSVMGRSSDDPEVSNIAHRQAEAGLVAPGPTTRAMRNAPKLKPEVARLSPISSTTRFAAPYGSSGAAASRSFKARDVGRSPYTLSELANTKRLTPRSTASRTT